MSLLKPKEKITVEQHAFLFLSAIYKFDPAPDFIRISRDGLLTKLELEKLKEEDHYLLTVLELKRLNWLWNLGKVENLSNKLDVEDANERIGYWFGSALACVFNEISGIDSVEKKAQKAWEAIEIYAEVMEGEEGETHDEIYDDVATEFTVRILGKNQPMTDLHREKIYSVSFFAEQILKQSGKEFRKPPFKLVYEPPKS